MIIEIVPPLKINTRSLSVKDNDGNGRTILTAPSWVYVSTVDEATFEARKEQYEADLNALVTAWNASNPPPETP